MKVCIVIPAAGVGSRMMASRPKQHLELVPGPGGTILETACRQCARVCGIHDVFVAVSPEDQVTRTLDLSGARVLASGGPTRGETVLRTLDAVARDCEYGPEDWVLVHDAARPLVVPEEIELLLSEARRHAKLGTAAGAVLAIPVTDTVKRIDADGILCGDIPREGLLRVATPQAFPMGVLRRALSADPSRFSDESSAVRALGLAVAAVPSSPRNFKITTPADLEAAREIAGRPATRASGPRLRTGLGYDSHRFCAGRPLILGGVRIPSEQGLAGHSDADVLAHAVTDAVLGAAALGNIGILYPDTDPKWKDADSMKLLSDAWKLVQRDGWKLGNLDCVIVAETPKLNPWLPSIRAGLARALGADVSRISVKPKTQEKMGFEGRREGMSVRAACLLESTEH